jgi:hypothetical protein
MARNVPRIASLIDLGGLVLFIAGAGCYFRAFVGMRHIEKDAFVATTAKFAALTEYSEFLQLSRIGMVLSGVAIATFIVAAVVARRNPVVAAPQPLPH